MGGKSPLIVFEDAEVEGCVDWILTGILWGSGQVCSATSRVLLHASIKDKVIVRLVNSMQSWKIQTDLSCLYRLLERVGQVKIGNSLGADLENYSGASMGPVVSKGQYDKIWAYIDDAKASGLKVLYGGDRDLVKVRFNLSLSVPLFYLRLTLTNIATELRKGILYSSNLFC